MCASRPGPAMLRGIGREGAGVWVIFSHRRQDFFGRAVSITFSRALISSRISLMSSPTSRSSPPQSGQASPGSSTMRSRGVASETFGFRRMEEGSATAGSAFGSSSGSRAAEAATSSASRASSSCSISRSIFSELAPNFWRWSLAIRIWSAWTRASCAFRTAVSRVVSARMAAFSASSAAIIARNLAGSSGGREAASDMRDLTIPCGP
jgi:hypothetical protein